jgi:hypothetical protein
VGSSCRAGTRRCRLHLDDHPSARIASNRVMHAKDDVRRASRCSEAIHHGPPGRLSGGRRSKPSSSASSRATPRIGELVGTAGLGGYGFNAVPRLRCAGAIDPGARFEVARMGPRDSDQVYDKIESFLKIPGSIQQLNPQVTDAPYVASQQFMLQHAILKSIARDHY